MITSESESLRGLQYKEAHSENRTERNMGCLIYGRNKGLNN